MCSKYTYILVYLLSEIKIKTNFLIIIVIENRFYYRISN